MVSSVCSSDIIEVIVEFILQSSDFVVDYLVVLKYSNYYSMHIYYPTALCRVQITPKTSTNITRYHADRLDRFPAVDQSVS